MPTLIYSLQLVSTWTAIKSIWHPSKGKIFLFMAIFSLIRFDHYYYAVFHFNTRNTPIPCLWHGVTVKKHWHSGCFICFLIISLWKLQKVHFGYTPKDPITLQDMQLLKQNIANSTFYTYTLTPGSSFILIPLQWIHLCFMLLLTVSSHQSRNYRSWRG